MAWDTAVLDMSIRIWIEKILLIIHIRSLDENALARRVYEEQKKNSWPGLSSETSLLCQTLSIEDCNLTKLGKTSYRKILLPACHKNNEEKLRNFAKGKCERINHEEYGKKEYIGSKKISQVMDLSRTRFGLQPFAGNYSNDRRFAKKPYGFACVGRREKRSNIFCLDIVKSMVT